MRKIILLILFLMCIHFSFSQQIYFAASNYTDSAAFKRNIPALAKAVIGQYKEKDEYVYNNNLFRLQLIAGDYAGFNTALKKLAWLDHGDSIAPTGLGFPFKIYMAALAAKPAGSSLDTSLYTNLFRQNYAVLKGDDQNWAAGYFDNDVAAMEAGFKNAVKKVNTSDSISLQDALQLCKTYCSYKTFAAVATLSKNILQKADNDKYIINDSVIIKMPDGGSIALTIVRSKINPVPVPVIMQYNIYAGRGLSSCKEAASRGYAGIEANTRGMGISPDTVQPFEHDAKDAYYIIDWISKQPWCNGKVGMYGGSYLGFSQWSAAKYIHPALKTIVPQVAVGAGIDYPMHNGVFMSYMLRWIHYVEDNRLTDYPGFSDNKKWDAAYLKWYTEGKSFRSLDTLEGRPNNTFQRWLQHPSYDSYWKSMTPQKEEFTKMNIPILTTTGYRDDDQIGAMYYYKQYHCWNKNPNYYLLIGPYDHGGAQGYPKGNIGGYKIDSVANIPIMDIVFQWFNYILKDSSKPAILKDKVNFEVMGKNEWVHVPSLDKMHNSTMRLYLGNSPAGNRYPLLASKPKQEAFIEQTIDLTDRSNPSFDGENMGSYPLLLDSVFNPDKHKIVFISDPVKEPCAISGAATASIAAKINKKDMDIVMELFELTPDGKYFALVQNIQRASFKTGDTTRSLLLPSKTAIIRLDNTYITSRQLQKGSRVIVVLGINKSPNWQINYGTGKDVSDETIKDGAVPVNIKWYNSSYIDLPVLK